MRKKINNKFPTPSSGMKLKKIGVGSLVIVTAGIMGLGIGINIISSSQKNTSATSENIIIKRIEDLEDYNSVGGVIYNRELDAKKEPYTPNSTRSYSSSRYGDSSTLPSRYNSYDDYGETAGISVKNQGTEGLCWAYAATSTMEYAINKNNNSNNSRSSDNVLSPKHIDYQFVDATDAYKANDVAGGATNSYHDLWVDLAGQENGRMLGDGGNTFTLELALSNPLALMSEDHFTNVIKANDNRLSSISQYEDIFQLDNANEILTNMSQYGRDTYAYTVKQSYDEINNPNRAKWIVTGARELYYPEYGSSAEKQSVVNDIKKAVNEYGAAEVFTYWDEESCMDESYSEEINSKTGTTDYNFVVIDRSSESWSQCNPYSGHAMTIIGWDDNLTYNDNGTEKTGAFILQNSWGNMGILGPNESVEEMHLAKYYMAYDSAFDALFFNSIEQSDSFRNIYSIDNYSDSVIIPGEDELIYHVTTNGGSETLKGFSYSQSFYPGIDYDIYYSNTTSGDSFKKVGSFTSYMGITKYDFAEPIAISGDFTIKIKTTNGRVVGDEERKINVMNFYTSDGGVTPDPTPAEDEPNGTVTWVQGQNYIIGSEEDLIVKVDYPVNLLASVTLDDEALPDGSYKTESGSTVLTIYSSYLDTLDEGTHTIKFAYSNGEIITTQFTVSEEDVAVPSTSGSATAEPGGSAASPNTGGNTASSNTAPVATGFAIPAIVILVLSACIFTTRSRHKVKFDRK